MKYQDFLKNKEKHIPKKGFTPLEMNGNLFEFQKHIVERSIISGHYGIFADCGLGKTIIELEIASQCVRHTNKKALILAPLAVCIQHKEEAAKFGFDLDKIDIVNYDVVHKINPNEYDAVLLDESSIIKNFEGKRKQLIMRMFKSTKYKFCFTATPSPNDPMELGNHSEFLNNKTRLEILAMYFVHDGGNTSKWRLKGHAVNLFYQFVSKWAVMLSKPADIGFEMQGYDLPSLNYIDHQIITSKKDNGLLLNDMAVSATDFNGELRRTQTERIEKAVNLASSHNNPVIIWTKQIKESEIVTKAIPGAVEVKGSDKPESKAEKLLGFAKGDFRVLVTKPKIAQYGLNYQHCSDQIHTSLDFSFEGLYQCIRRSYRFGAINPVNINIITTDTMQNVIDNIRQKEEQYNKMKRLMIKNQIQWTTKQYMETA